MINFQSVSKDRLFYDQYEYGVCINVEEASCLRAKTRSELLRIVEYRNNARRQYYSSASKIVIEGEVLENLIIAFDFLDQHRDCVKLLVSYNVMYVYSNDPVLLEKITQQHWAKFRSAVQACVNLPRDVVLLTNPQYQYRSYFKDKVLNETQASMLLNFLESRSDIYSITRSFRANLNRWRRPYIPRHLFVDHNDLKDITMLNLVVPGLIRKTLTVQAK